MTAARVLTEPAVVTSWSPAESVGVARTVSAGRDVWFAWAFLDGLRAADVSVGLAITVTYERAEGGQDGLAWRAVRVAVA